MKNGNDGQNAPEKVGYRSRATRICPEMRSFICSSVPAFRPGFPKPEQPNPESLSSPWAVPRAASSTSDLPTSCRQRPWLPAQAQEAGLHHRRPTSPPRLEAVSASMFSASIGWDSTSCTLSSAVEAMPRIPTLLEMGPSTFASEAKSAKPSASLFLPAVFVNAVLAEP